MPRLIVLPTALDFVPWTESSIELWTGEAQITPIDGCSARGYVLPVLGLVGLGIAAYYWFFNQPVPLPAQSLAPMLGPILPTAPAANSSHILFWVLLVVGVCAILLLGYCFYCCFQSRQRQQQQILLAHGARAQSASSGVGGHRSSLRSQATTEVHLF